MNSIYYSYLLSKGKTIQVALEQLNIQLTDPILFVVDDENRLVGTLTDGDVRRGLLQGFSLDDNVDEIIHLTPKYLRKGENSLAKVIEYREKNYKILPILDNYDRVVNVINFKEIKSYLPVDVVIMAGGRGERLKPLTDTIPKPLIMVGDKPILEHNLDRLRLFGIDEFWITVRYLGEQIEAYLNNGKEKNINIKYLYEKEPLGTIGAVSQIQNFEHEYILVTNSDLLTNIDYEHFFLDFVKQDADFSVVTIPYTVDVPYAVLETNNGNVINFHEKPTYTYYSNGGIYLMKNEIRNYIPTGKHFNATDLIEFLIKDQKKVVSYPLTGYWLDIGKHEDLMKAQRDIQHVNLK